MTGVAAGGGPELLETNVQSRMSWIATYPPVPAVNPTYAVLPPTRLGMLTDQEFVNALAEFAVSVMVIVSVMPSYAMCT